MLKEWHIKSPFVYFSLSLLISIFMVENCTSHIQSFFSLYFLYTYSFFTFLFILYTLYLAYRITLFFFTLIFVFTIYSQFLPSHFPFFTSHIQSIDFSLPSSLYFEFRISFFLLLWSFYFEYTVTLLICCSKVNTWMCERWMNESVNA